MPFVSSGAMSTVLTCAAKVVECTTPFWSLFQTMFASCVAVHSAFISPLQSLPKNVSVFQGLVRSTLQVAWALRVGVISALFFDLFKHISLGLCGDNRYLHCFWNVVSVVTVLPVVANPLCGLTTGAMVVGGVGVVSLLSRFVSDRFLFQEGPSLQAERPCVYGVLSEGPQAQPEPFFDMDSRRYYFRPPGGSELNDLLETYQKQGGYVGISVSREVKQKNLSIAEHPEQLCDVMMLTKAHDQIAFEREEERKLERGSLLSTFFKKLEYIRNCLALEVSPVKSTHEGIQYRIRKQEHLANNLVKEMDSRLKTIWKDAYSSFLVCGEKELRQLGYSSEIAQQKHALFLFYKPLPQEKVPITI